MARTFGMRGGGYRRTEGAHQFVWRTTRSPLTPHCEESLAEFSLGVYLIVKGFKPSPITEGM